MTEADVYAMVLGRTIAELRDRHGLSQVALANQAGLTQPTLSRIEKGATNPELHTLRRIAKAFGMATPALVAQAEAAFARTAQTAQGAGASPAQSDMPWWQAALGALGVASVVGLAVAAAMAAEEASKPAPEEKPGEKRGTGNVGRT
jgi:transcriptional regulator with XRE-family HTH domain